MSYARFGWDGSDVYVIGTTYPPGTHVIECCGCLFTPRGALPREKEKKVLAELPEMMRESLRGSKDWYLAAFPAFTEKPGILAHLREHQKAGHCVPAAAFTGIEEDDWLH